MCILMFSTWRVAGLLFRYFPCPVRQARTFRSGGSGGQDRSHGALFQMRRGTENFEECSVKTVVILIFQSKMPENFLSVISWRQSCLCSLLLTLFRSGLIQIHLCKFHFILRGVNLCEGLCLCVTIVSDIFSYIALFC